MNPVSSVAVGGDFTHLPAGFSLSSVTSTISVGRQVFFIQDSCQQSKNARAV